MDNYSVIKKSIIYIENNLHRDISLDELAAQAFCSKFNYHRVFKATTGETVMEYIRKRKLKRACLSLLRTNKSIKAIALECGFDFQQSFSRSFKKQYGISPMEYRKNKRTFIMYEKLGLDQKKQCIEKPDALSGPRIVKLAGFKFVGVKCLTTINDNSEQGVVTKLWEDFNYRIPEIKNRVYKKSTFGIGFHNSTSQLGYIACVKVDKSMRLPKGMEVKTIPPSKYAKFTHKGMGTGIVDSLDFIFGEWLIDSGCDLANDVDFIIRIDERYTGKEDSVVDIFIPIK